MRRTSRSWLAHPMRLGFVASLIPACAFAAATAVPSASTSVVPAVLVTCPSGHIPFTVTVKDFAGNPVANSTVVVDFCAAAPPIDICSTPGCTFSGTTGLNGSVVLDIPAGGVTASAAAVIRADGVVLAYRAVASTDQTGDLVVTPADVTAINALLGSTDKRGDLDGDGVVTTADVAIVQAHMNHACAGPVRVDPRTWGLLKTLYR